MAAVMRPRAFRVGRVAIWKQWLVVAAGVLLGAAFAGFVVSFIGWSLLRRLWPRKPRFDGQSTLSNHSIVNDPTA